MIKLLVFQCWAFVFLVLNLFWIHFSRFQIRHPWFLHSLDSNCWCCNIWNAEILLRKFCAIQWAIRHSNKFKIPPIFTFFLFADRFSWLCEAFYLHECCKTNFNVLTEVTPIVGNFFVVAQMNLRNTQVIRPSILERITLMPGKPKMNDRLKAKNTLN